MKTIFSVLAVLVLICSVSAAETFVLKDGSRISGSLLSYEDGIYTVETESMGTVKIKKTSVLKMLGEETQDYGDFSENDLSNLDLGSIMNAIGNSGSSSQNQGAGVDLNAIMNAVGGGNGAAGVDMNSVMKMMGSQDQNGSLDMGALLKMTQNMAGSAALNSSETANVNMENLMNVVSSPKFMEKLMGLMSNPAVQKLTSDPELSEAIQNQDFTRILSNPVFLELMQDPQFMGVVKEVTAEISQ